MQCRTKSLLMVKIPMLIMYYIKTNNTFYLVVLKIAISVTK